jgi:phosphoglycolate phosphatase-like HAD superfamily hydrolase
MKLVLFDIDGTLIDSGGAGTRALDLAMKELFSIDNGFQGINMAGKTDTHIIQEGLTKHGISVNGYLNAMIEAYIKYLQREIQNNRKHVKPGIYEVLENLRLQNSIGIGLLTGNLESGARIKLEPFHLNEYFPTGAFGSDDEDRNNLLPIAVERFENLLETNINIENCILIGDTPRDVECAHIHGTKCVGIATGPYSMNELREAGADYVMKDLSDYQALFQIL